MDSAFLTAQMLSVMSWYNLDSNTLKRTHHSCVLPEAAVSFPAHVVFASVHTWDPVAKRPKTHLILVLLLILIRTSGCRKELLGLLCEEAGANNNIALCFLKKSTFEGFCQTAPDFATFVHLFFLFSNVKVTQFYWTSEFYMKNI